MPDRSRAATALAMSTLAFTLCFAVWTLNGVLVTFLVENGLFRWDTAQIGWLIGIPVLTGSLLRGVIGCGRSCGEASSGGSPRPGWPRSAPARTSGCPSSPWERRPRPTPG